MLDSCDICNDGPLCAFALRPEDLEHLSHFSHQVLVAIGGEDLLSQI
jgi:hypothetical protein